jgi:predicted TIM-barrel fold metal-dependent hydrolase
VGPIVDAHTHIWSARSQATRTAGHDLRMRFMGVSAPPPLRASARALAETSVEHGVEQAVLIQPSFLGTNVRYLVSALDRDRSARAAVALLDPTAERPQAQIERLHRLGVVGVRLAPLVAPGLDWFGRASDDACALMAERGMTVSVLATSAQVAGLGGWLARHEQLNVVIDHLGRPDTHEGAGRDALAPLLRLAEHPNLSVKLSGLSAFSRSDFPHPDTGAWARRVVAEFGSERTLWGSDFPWTHELRSGYPGALGAALVALADLPSDALRNCFALTARRLHHLPANAAVTLSATRATAQCPGSSP